ncbi:MAG: thioredoxin family protein [Flavobacteriales bacterium]
MSKKLFFIICLISFACLKLKAQETVLEGELSPTFIAQLSDAPEWQQNQNNYHPDAEAMKHIAQYASEFDLVVVIGTWCEDSRMHFPALWKTIEQSGAKFKSIRIIAVDRDKKSKVAGFEALNITYVPTIILLKDGREMTRIVETPRVSVEKDLADSIHAK